MDEGDSNGLIEGIARVGRPLGPRLRPHVVGDRFFQVVREQGDCRCRVGQDYLILRI
jgi:hypothetical protein